MSGERTIYWARLVPIDRWTEIHDRDRGQISERFDRFAFAGEQRDPGRVTVDLRHVDEHDVGRLIRLQRRKERLTRRAKRRVRAALRELRGL